jgi:hypothetical protein
MRLVAWFYHDDRHTYKTPKNYVAASYHGYDCGVSGWAGSTGQRVINFAQIMVANYLLLLELRNDAGIL